METLGDRLVARKLWLDPHPVFARLRRDAPVWQLPGENAFLVSTWELVAEATSRVEDFSNHFRYMLFSHDDGTLGALETGPTGPDVFAGEDPPAHTAQRKIFFAELVQKKMDALGRGVHHCVGAPLARLEARVVLTKLLARTKSFGLDPDRAPRWSDSIWIHRHEHLPLVVEPS